jgi:hypothetical protein
MARKCLTPVSFYDQAAQYTEIISKYNSLREKLNVHKAAGDRLKQSITVLRSAGAHQSIVLFLHQFRNSGRIGR